VNVEGDLELGGRDLDRLRVSKTPVRRALVVEDDPQMCALLQEVLVSVEIEVVTPTKSIGNELHIDDEKFDLIIVGVCASPSADVKLIREFRHSGLNQMTPIILISSDQRAGALSRGLAAGATFFIYKPIERMRLMSLIRAIEGTIEQKRRRFRRVTAQVKVRLKSAKAEIMGETIDISLNGALVRSSHTLPVGSLIEVSLYLHSGCRPVVGLGSVVRLLDNSRMGILLDRFPSVEITRLQDYLLPKLFD
jgi:DNA-binding response OmpR family regulator